MAGFHGCFLRDTTRRGKRLQVSGATGKFPLLLWHELGARLNVGAHRKAQQLSGISFADRSNGARVSGQVKHAANFGSRSLARQAGSGGCGPLVKLCSNLKRKADSTQRSSQAVPHPSTNRALRCLTSEVEKDPVHSTRYGRRRMQSLRKGVVRAKLMRTYRATAESTGFQYSPHCASLVCALQLD